ncbi:hypothetical protein FF36_01212 [Frankia torreyi]|uniref:Uncharacterized protein n=1 Tax=Frankia torreyi TaxID=1856 RepID=A0A0D8BK16_9ACTN|nr:MULTISPECIES: hypothetical protein [Frankia]KJE24481.1 hypothetical protein FF36_01212 [Frankia torreyi]KQC38426.1 hypothetical protein UK82_10385 [Frankia sp. ACN1ag]KQM06349.1 hypothetical protein FF86_100973 [Frankia sp. CpI1-P]
MPADAPGAPSPDADQRVSEHGDVAAVPAAREGEPASSAAADDASAAVAVDTGSELVASLMSGIPTDEQKRLLGMINSSIAAERSAAIDGTVRRQVDVGVRRRRSSHRPDPDAADAADERGGAPSAAHQRAGEPGTDGSRGEAGDG